MLGYILVNKKFYILFKYHELLILRILVYKPSNHLKYY